jgi:aminoglycoside phosphotransferase (APT) family kinase protein
MALDPQIQKHSRPLLLHPGLHKRNIFVSEDDPTVITAIIDWQGASVEPAF